MATPAAGEPKENPYGLMAALEEGGARFGRSRRDREQGRHRRPFTKS
jgi:hypothetical protein